MREKDQALARRFQDEAWTLGELIATVREEERKAAFKEAIEIAKAELIPDAGEGSTDEDFNAATQDVIVALTRAAAENRKEEG